MKNQCSIPECNGPLHGLLYCEKHYRRVLNYGSPDIVRPNYRPEIRFWKWIEKTTKCWNWTGTCDRAGYGRISINRRSTLAHRYSWELLKGKIPEGLTLDHICRNRKCVNPDHLEPVTLAENIMRGEGACAKNARKTHCKNGHPFDESNTYMIPTGGRQCRTCIRLSVRRYNAKKVA